MTTLKFLAAAVWATFKAEFPFSPFRKNFPEIPTQWVTTWEQRNQRTKFQFPNCTVFGSQ